MSVTLVFNANQGSSTLTFDGYTYTSTDGSAPYLNFVSDSSSITNINSAVFTSNTDLVSVDLTSSVTTLDYDCFNGCTALLSFTMPGVTSIGNGCFALSGLTSITIPSGVTSLPDTCFEGCSSLTSISMSSVTTLGIGCFLGCGFTSITIPSGLTSLSIQCFDNCSSLTSITMPDVTSIGVNCFRSCGFTSITIPSGVTSLPETCFSSCSSLSSISMPSVSSIGTGCFSYCGFVNLTLPSGITTLPNECFMSCGLLTNISLPNVTSINADVFTMCSALTSISMPNVTFLGSYCFSGCGFTTLSIPPSVTTISDYCFYNCASLSSLQILSSVITISGYNLVNGTATPFTLYTDAIDSVAAIWFQANYPGATIVVGSPPGPPVVCFKEDTRILCLIDEQEVYVPINTLKKGDLIKTHTGAYVPVNMLGTDTLNNPGDSRRVANRLYVYSKNNNPELTEDLVITGLHSVCVDSLTEWQSTYISRIFKGFGKIGDKFLLLACLDTNAEPYTVEDTFTVWHVALDAEDDSTAYGIYANGKLVESCSKNTLVKTMQNIL